MRVHESLRACLLGATLAAGMAAAQTGSPSAPPPPGALSAADSAQRNKEKLIDVPAGEKATLERLHDMNQREIQLGRLAQQKASDPAVKDFARKLVTDHQRADQRILTHAQAKGMRLEEPRASTETERKLQKAEQASIEKLRVLQGPVFDRAFMAHMVGGHDLTLAKIASARQQTSDPQLQALLIEIQPTIAEHREQAHRILGQLQLPAAASPAIGGSGQEASE